MNHRAAREIVRAAWQSVHGVDPSPAERAYTQAVAFLETGYGRAGQHGELAARGLYNWGNLERVRDAAGECPAGYAPGVDAGKDVCFRVYPTDVDAAAAMIRELTTRRPWVHAAMTGDPFDVASSMKKEPSYYSASVLAYETALRSALRGMGEEIGAPPWNIAAGAAVLLVAAGLVVGVLRLRG